MQVGLKQRRITWVKQVMVVFIITIFGTALQSAMPARIQAAADSVDAYITPVVNTPAGGTFANPAIIPAGSWLDFNFGYTGGTEPDVQAGPIKTLLSWVNIDVRDQWIDSYQHLDPACAGQFNCHADYSDVAFSTADSGSGDDGDIGEVGHGCWQTDDNPFNGQPCAEQGFFAQAWGGNHTERTYRIRVKLSPTMYPGAKICISTHVARSTKVPTPHDADIYNHLTSNTPDICYIAGYSLASGTVLSTLGKGIQSGPATNTATGNNFKITDDCYLGGTLRWASRINGYWESEDPAYGAGSHYALGAPMCFSVPDNVTQSNTRYAIKNFSFSPPGQAQRNDYPAQVAGLNCGNGSVNSKLAVACNHHVDGYTWNVADNIAFDATSDNNFNFTYAPITEHPTITKTSTPLPRATDPAAPAVAPGEPMRFNLTSTNDHDGYVKDYLLEDPIPLNMEPNATSLSASLVINYGGFAPGFGSSGNIALDCSTGGTPHSIPGYGVNVGGQIGSMDNDGRFIPGGNQYQCYVETGGGVPRIYVHFNVLPYRSTVNVAWTGNVKATAAIDSYTYAYPACGDSAGIVAACVDRSAAGLQGVINQARVASDLGAGGWEYSDVDANPANGAQPTYNAIPGQVNCTAKWASAPMQTAQSTLRTPLVSAGCGAALKPGVGDQWVYAPNSENPDYGKGAFNTQVVVNFDPAAGPTGPVFYTVSDQAGGAALDPAISSIDSVSPSTTISNPLAWGEHRASSSDTGIYTFNATFGAAGGRAYGGKLTNTSQVCWVQYWTPGHPSTCQTPSMEAMYINVKKPFITAKNGDVHAGGGIVQANGHCTTSLTSNDLNPKSSSDYFVTASGNAGAFFSSAVGAAAPTYGAICRPDVVTSTNTYQSRQGGAITYNPATPQSAYDGKVVDIGSPGTTTTLNAMQISSRWTLHVKGNLYIAGAITSLENNIAALNGSPETRHSSFGVVVDGNLLISKDVTSLTGFYFVNGVINTCSAANGTTTLGAGYSVADCRNALTVSGMLLASQFRLNRTNLGPANDQAAEYVTLNDRLYTATPPGFSDLTKANVPVYLGDTKPRY